MKTFWIVTLVMFTCLCTQSQDYWTQRENMSIARIGATGFSINNMGYIGMGRSASQQYLKDMWMYDPNGDTWTQKAMYPGEGSYSLSVAVVGNYVYMGLGYNGTQSKTDWWRYDPVTDTYLQLSSYIGLPRYGASAFAVGDKIYLIAGSYGGVPYYQDCYVYDIPSGVWSQISNFPAGLRNHTNTFSYNGKGYVTCGTIDLTLSANDMWEYSPLSDTWAQKTSLPALIRTSASGFQIGNFLYVCTGFDNSQSVFLTDLWEYNILTDTWVSRATFPGPARYFGVGFAAGGFGYVATGGDFTNVNDDIYQYTPFNISVPEISGSSPAGINISLYPNPASQSATVTFSQPVAGGQLSLLDIAGRVCSVFSEVNGSELKLDLSGLTAGIYSLKLIDQNGGISFTIFQVQ